MSYRIVYGPEIKTPGKGKSSQRKRIIFALCIGFLIIAARSTGIDEVLLHWLIPGEPAITEAAFLGLLDRIQNGDAFSEAITVFCREILAGAQIA